MPACQSRTTPGESRHRTDPWAEIPLTQFDPSLVLGTGARGGEDLFGDVTDLATGPDGEIIVLDALNHTVRVFSSAGTELRRFGRKGRGPVEFESPIGIARVGIRLVVADSRLALLTLEGGDAGTNQSVNFGVYEDIQSVGPTVAILSRTTIDRASTATRIARQFAYDRIDVNDSGARPAPFFVLPDTIYRVGSYVGEALLGARPVVTVSPSGDIFFSRGDSLIVNVRRYSGDTARFFFAPTTPVPTSGRDFDDRVSRRMEIFSRVNQKVARKQIEAAFRDIPRAEYRPVIRSMIASYSGSLLIQRSDVTARPFLISGDRTSAEWDMLHFTGTPTARFNFPLGFEPLVFEGCTLIGRFTNDEGEVSVRVYNLPRAASCS